MRCCATATRCGRSSCNGRAGAGLRTGTGRVRARRVVLAGRRPSGLVPAGGPVVATGGRGSYVVPALGRALADSAARA
ncbi:hypothetical protein BJF78_21140 [Pseudonocardia sp. CNS-139]|nr:hypothetical protein BJF78_21140 [Pseudonocardia sp. CNS-139]